MWAAIAETIGAKFLASHGPVMPSKSSATPLTP
jgi:hypothetical protein